MDAFSFLQQIQAHTENNLDIKTTVLGRIDYNFDPSRYPQEWPRVEIDGQGLSNRGYPCLASYTPLPGDRVFLMPHGTTYLILGAFDRTDDILLKPGQLVFQAFQTEAQPIHNSTPTALIWGEAPVDILGGWSDNDNPSRYQPATPGWYQLSGGLGLEAGEGSFRDADWAVNGSPIKASGSRFTPTSSGQATKLATRTRTVFLNGDGDYVELLAGHNRTAGDGNLNTDLRNEFVSYMEAVYVGTSGPLSLRSLE
jgi:hypothetical protein